MKLLRSRVLLVVLSAFFTCFSVSASTVKSGFSERIVESKGETNSVRVRCFLGEAEFKLSVASVLESRLTYHKSNRRDIALTTGHGLIGDDGKMIDDCYVYGPTGRKVKVKTIKMAPNYQEATGTDWAVLVFDRMKTPGLIRYTVDPSLSVSEFETLANEQADVKFSKARGILKNRQNCNLYPRRNASLLDKRFDGIVPHSCKAIRGQSGSPVSVAGINGDIVIGIHLGKSFSLPIENVTDRAGWFGFMRIIDNSFLVDLEAIVSELERSY
jgi:hypothetical protein